MLLRQSKSLRGDREAESIFWNSPQGGIPMHAICEILDGNSADRIQAKKRRLSRDARLFERFSPRGVLRPLVSFASAGKSLPYPEIAAAKDRVAQIGAGSPEKG